MYLITTMLFMIAALFSLVKTMKYMAEDVNSGMKKNASGSRAVKSTIKITGLFYIPAFFLLLAPFIKSFIDAGSDQVNQSNSNLPVWLYLAGGVYLLLGAAFLLRNSIREKTLGKVGSILQIQVLFWVGLYSTYAAYDHLKFAGENFGIMSTQLVDAGAVTDVFCEQPVMLVNYTEGQTAPMWWRCPNGFSLLNQTNRPFVPWPEYTEGRSKQLTAAMNKIMTEAKANSK